MNSVQHISCFLAIGLLGGIGQAQAPDKPLPMEKPKLPFVQKNVCPFECCTYTDWTAKKKTILYDTWKRAVRKAIGSIDDKEQVKATTGVVITYRAGRYIARESAPWIKAKKGDEILVYSYRGEGYYDFWFKGKLYSDQVVPDATCSGKRNERLFSKTPTTFCSADEGEHEWWALVKTRTGLTGWVNMDESEFDNIDACA